MQPLPALKLGVACPLSESPTFGVGHPTVRMSVPATGAFSAEQEAPFPLVGGTDFRRCKQTCRNLVTQSFRWEDEVVPEGIKYLSGEQTPDVFEEEPLTADFGEDSDGVTPEPPVVSISPSFPSHRGRSAGDSPKDKMNASTPASAVEGGKVREERSRMEPPCRHVRNKDLGGIGFPFDVTTGAETFAKCKSQPKFESANTGTQAESIDGAGGMKSHVISSSPDRQIGRKTRPK